MPATDIAVDLKGAKIGGDVSIQFGLTAAPTSFRRLVGNFVKLYLGTEQSPVPFGGRGREIKALNAWLDGHYENSCPTLLSGDLSSSNLLITAPAGRGKTALLVRWIEQLHTDWSLVFIPVSIRAETNQALTFYQAFAARLAEILGEALPEPRADPAAYYKDKVIDYLDRIGKGSKNCLVVIDGLDEARGWKMDTTVLPVEASPRLKIVISARELAGDNESQNWLDRLGWTPPLSSALTLQVQPLSREGIADVLAKMEFPIGPLSKDVDIIDELYRLTDEGDPLVLHFYTNDLLKKGDEAARLKPTDLRKLEPGFGAYIKRWLDEQKAEWKSSGTSLDEDLVDAIFAVLASALGPLKLPELEELATRILPGNRIFSVRTIEPLRRFIVGDGKENGYALAHPKLASFLQRDYFAESRVLRDSQIAFVTWMREVVLSLNNGRRLPKDTPTYALLFYTQHLSMMPPDTALEHYRELVENGWRKAWENQESGFQGFSRDIELAARAFRTAVERNPDQLQKPRTGLGALIRCALCLSSIRSAGLGATGEVLAEFLRSRLVTPKQALYLAQLKEDKNAGEAIGAIIELLPIELRLEAYASAIEINNPQTRFEVLYQIAPHLAESDRERAFLAALRAAQLIKIGYVRSSALTQLEQFLPAKVWAEASAAEEARLASERLEAQRINEQGQRPRAESAFAFHPPTQVIPPNVHMLELMQEVSRANLSQDRIHEILEMVAGWDDYGAAAILKALGPRLSRELQVIALDIVWSGQGDLYKTDRMIALVPYLANDSLERVVQHITERPTYNSEKLFLAVANQLGEKGIEKLLQHVFAMKDGYERMKALSTLVPILPSAGLVETAYQWALSLDGYYAGQTIALLVPYISIEKVVACLRTAKVESLAEILLAFMPNMPREFLPEAVKLAVQITNTEKRGEVLAKLLPRLREAELSVTITDAYLATFVIGDSSIRVFAQATLIPYLSEDYAGASVDKLCADLNQMATGRDDVATFFHAMALALTSALPNESESAKRLEQAIAEVRDISDPVVRAISLGILSVPLPLEQGARLLKEAVDLSRTVGEMSSFLIAILATLHAPEDIQVVLEQASRQVESSSDEEEKRVTPALIHIVSALTMSNSIAQMQSGVAKGVKMFIDGSDDDDSMRRLMTPFLILVFSPKLSKSETDDLIHEILTVLQEVGDTESRGPVLALLTPYLPKSHLWDCFSELLDIAARSHRPDVFAGLALAQGLVNECFKRNSKVGGNLIPGSPLARLGGLTSVNETMEAIHDVCSWWD